MTKLLLFLGRVPLGAQRPIVVKLSREWFVGSSICRSVSLSVCLSSAGSVVWGSVHGNGYFWRQIWGAPLYSMGTLRRTCPTAPRRDPLPKLLLADFCYYDYYDYAYDYYYYYDIRVCRWRLVHRCSENCRRMTLYWRYRAAIQHGWRISKHRTWFATPADLCYCACAGPANTLYFRFVVLMENCQKFSPLNDQVSRWPVVRNFASSIVCLYTVRA